MSVFANEVIVVTGAASGIGHGITRTLMAEGAAVAAIDRAAAPLEQLAKEFHGKRFAFAVADVTDRAAITAAVRHLEEKLGPTDRLIASAGIGRPTEMRQFSAADFAEIVHVNLIGVANSVEAVLPGMIERKRGHLVVLSSLASFRGLPMMSAYCASKAGVNSLFDSMAVELKPLGISCTTICPGWIRTPLTDQIKFKMKGLLEVDDAGRHILGAIRRKQRFLAFPRGTAVLLRLMRWLPPAVADRLMARLIKGLDRQSPSN
jgi:NAD(P)-dependent dehydrogenase (short-subunit alcohol dehydrogenase family)